MKNEIKVVQVKHIPTGDVQPHCAVVHNGKIITMTPGVCDDCESSAAQNQQPSGLDPAEWEISSKAAPALFAALKSFEDIFAATERDQTGLRDFSSGALLETREKARAAISLAEGGEITDIENDLREDARRGLDNPACELLHTDKPEGGDK